MYDSCEYLQILFLLLMANDKQQVQPQQGYAILAPSLNKFQLYEIIKKTRT